MSASPIDFDFASPHSYDSTKCAECGTDGPTEIWTGEGGAVGYVHGAYQYWCRRCILSAQIAYAKRSADRLAGLRAELAALDG